MTVGHRHRVVRVRDGGLVHRALTYPLTTTTNRHQAARSRFTWGKVVIEEDGHLTYPSPQVYRLTALGVLHGLFGITLLPEDR